MSHGGPTPRGMLIFMGVVGVCATVSAAFFFSFLHDEGVDASTMESDFAGYQISSVTIDGQPIRVAIADTPALQELGLGNRDELPDGDGMLFVFSVDKEYAFWMKDMLISIDMVWLSENGSIVYMAQDVAPSTYPADFVPTSPARYVLELPAGYAQAHGFKVGDVAKIKN